MASEQQLTISSAPVDGEADAVLNTNGGGGIVEAGGDEGGRAPRLPRWTRQEILILIQGKRVAENRVRRGRAAGLGFGSVQVEPKWASVSSYCKRHGVNRGPVQCRKRWSNLAGDYKKIKEWESQIQDESESFWMMRNDVRREKKLPGFFDKEVYDILDGQTETGGTSAALSLALAAPPEEKAAEELGAIGEEKEVEKEPVVFDSGRSAAAEDGLFSDFEMGRSPEKDTPEKGAPADIPAPIPISEMQYQPFTPEMAHQGADEKQPALDPETGSATHEARKRRRFTDEGDSESARLQDQLVDVLERNGRMLSAHLEAQNTNSKLDREERKDYANSLVAVLNKLADALGRIADKL